MGGLGDAYRVLSLRGSGKAVQPRRAARFPSGVAQHAPAPSGQRHCQAEALPGSGVERISWC